MRCRGAPPPRPSPGRCGRSDAVLLPLLLLLLLLRASPAAAFAPGRSAAQRRPPSLVASPARKDDGDGGNVLSDVDARVLRSILEDEKLDGKRKVITQTVGCYTKNKKRPCVTDLVNPNDHGVFEVYTRNGEDMMQKVEYDGIFCDEEIE